MLELEAPEEALEEASEELAEALEALEAVVALEAVALEAVALEEVVLEAAAPAAALAAPAAEVLESARDQGKHIGRSRIWSESPVDIRNCTNLHHSQHCTILHPCPDNHNFPGKKQWHYQATTTPKTSSSQ